MTIWMLSAALVLAKVSFSPSIPLTDHLWQTAQVVAFDLDQDGDLDLIGSEHSGSRVVWWLNDGEGNFGFGEEWIWEEDPSASILALGDFDDDSYLEVLVSRVHFEGPRPESLMLADWVDGEISFPQVASSLVVEEELYFNNVLHLNDDGVPDIVTLGNVYLSDPEMNYQQIEGAGWNWEAISAEVDDDEILEIFDISEDNEIIRYDLSVTEPLEVRVIAKIPDDESLKVIVFHPATKEVISFSLKDLSKDEDRAWDNKDSEWILRAHPCEGDSDTIPQVIHRKTYLGTRSPYLFLHLDEESERVVVNEFHYDGERSRFRAEYFEIVDGDQDYELVEILGADYLTYEVPPLFRDLDGDESTDLVFPFSSIPRTTGSFVDQLSWVPGNESGDWLSQNLRPISTEGLNHDFKFFGDIDGDGDNDFMTQFTEANNNLSRGIVVVWENDGAGNFERHKVLADPDNVYGSFEVIRAFDVSGAKNWLSEVPEVSNEWPEGRMDFLVSYQNRPGTWFADASPPRVRYLLQDHAGGFHFSDVEAPQFESNSAEFRLFDWDRDGKDELIAFTYELGESETQVMLAEFEGSELKEFSVVGPRLSYPKIVDLDQDGFFDLVSSNEWSFGPGSYWHRNDGSDSFLEAEVLSYSLRPMGYDLDGDGYEDYEGRYENRDTFVVPGALKEEAVSNEEPRSFRIGSFDIDGDGDLDRFYDGWVSRSSSFIQFAWDETLDIDEGKGIVTRRHQVSTGALRLGPASQETKGFGDIDGDGLPDFLYVCANRIEWFKMARTEEPASFSQWMASLGLTGHSASLDLDFDFDGRSNWEEFVFGSHPALQDRDSSSIPGVRMGDDGMEFSFLFRNDAQELGITRDHFRSRDLANWIPMGEDPTVAPVDDEYQRISYPLTPGLGREFFQTTISRPPAE